MTSQPDNDEFLTVAEVATLLKINEQTVRNWIDRGELAAVRAGRRVRIRRAALDEVLTAVAKPRDPVEAPPAGGPSADDFWGGVAVGAAELAAASIAETPTPAAADDGSGLPDEA